MRRRAFLATAGSITAATAGCLSNSGSNSPELDPQDPDPSASEVGLAPDPVDLPEREVSEDRFKDYKVEGGTTIKLIPLDVAYYWYGSQKARFVDTRVQRQYDAVHIQGAAHSPAPQGGGNDPLDDVEKQDRIVSYCTCPHHLSGLRTANLLDNGYTGAYALDPGFEPWVQKDYPIGGSDSTNPDMSNYPDDYSRVQRQSD